jgi:acetylornithine deacetylase
MQPAVAERGLMVVDCIARGVAGHAAREEGDNAIYRAMADVEWLRSYQFPLVSTLLGTVKATVTTIAAGALHNVVPDECRFTVDVRVNDRYTNSEVLDVLRQHLASEVAARSLRLNSSCIAREHPVVRRCERLGRIPYASPTTSNQALMPFPSLKIGPGDSARSHTADEYVRPEEVYHAIRLYEQILDNLMI